MGELSHLTNIFSVEDPSQGDRPKVTDFENFLPWACKQYCIGMKVIVIKTQDTYVSVSALQKKSSRNRNIKQSKVVQPLMRSEFDTNDKESSTATEGSQENAIIVDTLYDSNQNLLQLKFLKNKMIPQKVMKVVALTIPYHQYLTSITINRGLDIEILHEISKFLPDSNITELCFDGAFVSEGNYYILLTHEKLKHLSLAKCSINDAVVKTIMDQLGYPHPASKVLSALNLSSNRITDVGATYIAHMLRTNRQLSYLNLAGNMLTDEGGISILNTLQKFPLEAQEVYDCRARYLAFLKQRNDLVNTYIVEPQSAREVRNNKKKSLKKGKLEDSSRQHLKCDKEIDSEAQMIKEKAESMADKRMGLYNDHFSPKNSELRDGVLRCLGNNSLCCLNLAYNNLTYASVKKLHEVLQMQASLNRTPKGLIRVVIVGNPMPISCKEYDKINSFLESGLVGIRKQTDVSFRKKTLIKQ